MTSNSKILPFPLAGRRVLVERLARQMSARLTADANKHLAFELRRHRAVLGRKQLAGGVIDAELRAFECAVRAKLWHLVMTPPRPTGAA